MRVQLDVDLLRRLREATPNCKCCGVQLDYAASVRAKVRPPSKATLDKVVPERGYVDTNIAIICWECNLKKQNNTVEDLRRLLAYVEAHGCE